MENFYMGNLFFFVNKLIEKQSSSACFTFNEVIKALMESTGHDNITDFANDLCAKDCINNGNPYFKETLIHYYKKTEL